MPDAPSVSAPEARPWAARYAATTGRLWTVAVWVQAAAFVAAGLILYVGTRPPVCAVTPNALSIRAGFSSAVISRTETVGVSFVNDIPAAHKRSGFDVGPYLRGTFTIDRVGTVRLYVTRGYPPYLVVQTVSSVSVVNFKEAARTRALHDELIRAWHLPG